MTFPTAVRTSIISRCKQRTGIRTVIVRGARTSQVGSTMGVHDTFGPACSSRGEGNREHVVLVVALRVKPRPSLAMQTIIAQSLQDSVIKGTAQLAFSGVSVCVDDQRHIGVLRPEVVEQGDKLMVDDDGINLGKVEYVGDVIRLQSVVDAHVDPASGSNAKNGLEEGGGVGSQNPDPLEAMFLQIVGEAARSVGKLDVRPSQSPAVRRYVKDGFSIWFNCRGTLEEECRGELVNVMGWPRLILLRR